MDSSFISINDVLRRSRNLCTNFAGKKPDSVYEERCLQAIDSRNPRFLIECIDQVANIKAFDINLVLECLDILSEVGTVTQVNTAVNRIISEAEVKVRDASALNYLLKQRLGRLTHKNSTKISNKLDDAFDAVGNSLAQMQSKIQISSPAGGGGGGSTESSSEPATEAVIIGYNRMIDESVRLIHCDRILENYGSISKRFNIDKLFTENVFVNGVEDTVNELCRLIDTYDMDTGTKLNTVIESSWYALNTNHIQYDMSTVLEVATDYYLRKDNGLYICRNVLENTVVVKKGEKSKVIYITSDDEKEQEEIENNVQEALYSYVSNRKLLTEDEKAEEKSSDGSKEKDQKKEDNSAGYDSLMQNSKVLADAYNNFYSGNYESIKMGSTDFYKSLGDSIQFFSSLPSDVRASLMSNSKESSSDVNKMRQLITAKSKQMAQVIAFYKEMIKNNIGITDYCRNSLAGNAISIMSSAGKSAEYLEENIYKYKKRDGVYDLSPIGLGSIYYTTKNTGMEKWAPGKLFPYLSKGYDCIVCTHTIGTTNQELVDATRGSKKDQFGNDSELVQIKNLFATKENENRKFTTAERQKIRNLAAAAGIEISKLPRTSKDIEKLIGDKSFFGSGNKTDDSKIWAIQPVNTLSGGPFTDMNKLLENLIKEGKKNVLICTTNRNGAKLTDKIIRTPNFKVTVNESVQEAVHFSDLDIAINALEEANISFTARYGIDYYDDESLLEGYKFIQNNELLRIVNESIVTSAVGWAAIVPLCSQLMKGLGYLRKQFVDFCRDISNKLNKYNANNLGQSSSQTSGSDKKQKKINISVLQMEGVDCHTKDTVIGNMSELITIISDATESIYKALDKFSNDQQEILEAYEISVKEKERAAAQANKRQSVIQGQVAKQQGQAAKPTVSAATPTKPVQTPTTTTVPKPTASTPKPPKKTGGFGGLSFGVGDHKINFSGRSKKNTSPTVQHNSASLNEYSTWLDNIVYYNAHGYIIMEDTETSEIKDFQTIFNDFKKNNSESEDITSKLTELVGKLYSINVENAIEGTPTLLSYIRRILIFGTGAINPILMLVGLIANEFMAIYSERKEVERMITAFRNERDIAKTKMDSTSNPEEKEKLKVYIKSLNSAMDKMETYQINLLSNKEIDDKYNNYASSTDDFKDEVDPDMSDMDLNRMLDELDDSDYDISFKESDVLKFIPLMASLCESLVREKKLVDNIEDDAKMISIMTDDDIKNYATFSTMFPDCIDPENLYVSISKYYDDISREGLRSQFESSIDKYRKMGACKEAMQIIENRRLSADENIDIYDNCSNVYRCCTGLKGIREFDDCLINKGSYILEASFMNKLRLAKENLRKSIVNLSDKEKEISKSVDVSFNHVVKGAEKALTNNNRIAVINGSILPSASRVIKLAITAGLASLIQPALAVIVVLGYFGVSKGLQTRERKRIIDELDIELKMCNKYIDIAESKGDMKKLKTLYTIQRELERQRQRLKYNLNAKGVVLVNPTSQGGY